MATRFLVVVSMTVSLVLALAFIPQARPSEPVTPETAAHDGVDMAVIPLYFEENLGQSDAQVRYLARAQGYSLFLTDNRIAFNLVTEESSSVRTANRPAAAADRAASHEPEHVTRTYGLYLDFVGANESPVLTGEEPQGGITSYFRGKPEEWVTGAQHFSKIRYGELYAGIDAVFYASTQQIQYDFIVAPGADPAQIQLRFDPVDGIALNDAGDLNLILGDRTLTMRAPYSYQTNDGVDYPVESRFVVDDGLVSFEVGAYDASQPLVIDPVFAYAGYFGGGPSGVAVDAVGHMYVAGGISGASSTFPPTGGPYVTPSFGTDAFVAKLNPNGTGVIFAGYIGGEGTDIANDIAIDASGNVYIGGNTNSSELTFPVSVGPDLTFNGIGVTATRADGFVAKVSADGTSLIYAGYIGGKDSDWVYGIAVDADGHAYVTGTTFSSQSTFPVLIGPDLTRNGDYEAFVAKVSVDGSSLIYAGYIGGGQDDGAADIAVDSDGAAYVVGYTYSTEATFPVKVGPDLTYSYNPFIFPDAFVAKVKSSGKKLAYAGYFGSYRADQGTAIAVDAQGRAVIAGVFDWGTDLDAFIAKVSESGSAYLFANVLGGLKDESVGGVALDSFGNIYLVGTTRTTDGTFPTFIGPDTTHNGKRESFVSMIDATGSFLFYSGFIGGAEDDYGYAIAVDPIGDAYVVGHTASLPSSFPEYVGPFLSHTGGGRGYVAKVSNFIPIDTPNILLNGGFETEGASSAENALHWLKDGLLPSDKRKCEKVSARLTAPEESCVFQFKADAASTSKRKLYQNLTPTNLGNNREQLAIYALVNGKSLGQGSKITVKVKYADASTEKFSTPIPGGSYDYLPVFASMPLNKTVASASVTINVKPTPGRLRVDDVQLLVVGGEAVPRTTQRLPILPLPEAPAGFRGTNSMTLRPLALEGSIQR
ncbi:MAG: SBBP repeat-containing protein [Chloroflexi bacterium]|nr:SBBP repeat-containing protein [Chloroflexota bacterium]